MLLLSLRDGPLKEWALSACAKIPVRLRDLGPFPAVGTVAPFLGTDTTLVHDLHPDPEIAIEWLKHVGGEVPVQLFLLQSRPNSDILSRLLRVDSTTIQFRGVAFLSIDSEQELARRLRSADRSWSDLLIGRLQTELGWSVDLSRIAGLLLGPHPPTTVSGLAREAEVEYGRLRSWVRRVGFETPLPFLHTVRVLVAHALLRGGETVAGAARTLGCGKTDTLRRHFGEILGRTPTEARKLDEDDVLDAIARTTLPRVS